MADRNRFNNSRSRFYYEEGGEKESDRVFGELDQKPGLLAV